MRPIESAIYARMYGLFDSKLHLTTSSEKYGTDKSKRPANVPNYFYRPTTATSNLRKHLLKIHPEEYDKAIKTHGWGYHLSSDAVRNPRDTCNQESSPYTDEKFHHATAVWIVADDQVSLEDLTFLHILMKSTVYPCC